MSSAILDSILAKYVSGDYTASRAINTMLASGVRADTVAAYLDSKLASAELSYNGWVQLKDSLFVITAPVLASGSDAVSVSIGAMRWGSANPNGGSSNSGSVNRGYLNPN